MVYKRVAVVEQFFHIIYRLVESHIMMIITVIIITASTWRARGRHLTSGGERANTAARSGHTERWVLTLTEYEIPQIFGVFSPRKKFQDFSQRFIKAPDTFWAYSLGFSRGVKHEEEHFKLFSEFSLFPRQRARVPRTDKEVYCGVHSLPRLQQRG